VKGSFKLRPRRVLTRSEAWACFTANLALAGSGSLAAGRPVGYAQIAAIFLSMILTFVAAVPFFQWAMAGGGVPQSPLDDPFQNLRDILYHCRWVLASFGLYLASVLWATMTSLSILAEAKREGVPPRIQ
jgi:hypothetical protein